MGMGVQAADDQDGSYRPMAEINITPMVDVMLVLLIIFMVAAPLMVSGVPIQLPKTSAAKVGQTKKPMVVTLTAEGKMQIRDEFIGKEDLIPRLQSIRASEGDAVVYVRADTKLPYGDVMLMLGQVGEAGFSRVSLLSTRLPGMPSAGSAASQAPAATPAPAPAAGQN